MSNLFKKLLYNPWYVLVKANTLSICRESNLLFAKASGFRVVNACPMNGYFWRYKAVRLGRRLAKEWGSQYKFQNDFMYLPPQVIE